MIQSVTPSHSITQTLHLKWLPAHSLLGHFGTGAGTAPLIVWAVDSEPYWEVEGETGWRQLVLGSRQPPLGWCTQPGDMLRQGDHSPGIHSFLQTPPRPHLCIISIILIYPLTTKTTTTSTERLGMALGSSIFSLSLLCWHGRCLLPHEKWARGAGQALGRWNP